MFIDNDFSYKEDKGMIEELKTLIGEPPNETILMLYYVLAIIIIVYLLKILYSLFKILFKIKF